MALPVGAPPVDGRRQRRRRLYIGAIIGAGWLVLLWSAIVVARAAPGPALALLIALASATAWWAIRIPGVPVSFSLADAFTITAALLYGPGAGALAVGCECLVLSFRLKRENRTWQRILFNVAAPALAIWVATQLLVAAAGPSLLQPESRVIAAAVVWLALFALTYFLVNTTLVAGAVVIGREASFKEVWRQHFAPLWVTYFAGTSIAGVVLLTNAPSQYDRPAPLLALALVLLVVLTIRSAVHLRQRGAQLAEMRLYAASLRSTTDAVALADDKGRVTFINPAAERLTGWTLAEARQQMLTEVFRIARTSVHDQDGLGDAVVREYVLIRRDGAISDIEASRAVIRDEDDTICGVIYVFRDISARKALEAGRLEVLRREQDARAAADHANRLKDDFLAIVSHELRTPVTAIMGWTQLLRGGRLDEEHAHKALDALERSARAQSTVLSDLFDTSQIVRGALRLEVRGINVADPIRDAVETVEPAIAAKRLDLRVYVEPELPVIDADPDRLRQIFSNLLANAIKFTPPEGWIELSARREGHVIRMDVVDSGCGISPAFLPYVFDPFRQADSSTTRMYPGLGLGLAIVRHLTEAHGGTVEAWSDGEGRGARFTVRIPVSRGRHDTNSRIHFHVQRDETSRARG